MCFCWAVSKGTAFFMIIENQIPRVARSAARDTSGRYHSRPGRQIYVFRHIIFCRFFRGFVGCFGHMFAGFCNIVSSFVCFQRNLVCCLVGFQFAFVDFVGPTIEVLLRQDCRQESIQIDKEPANCRQVSLTIDKQADKRLQITYKKL